MVRLLTGVGYFIGGGVILATSACMSFHGYQAEWGFGPIGVGIAILAFVASAGVGIATRAQEIGLAVLSGALALSFSTADIYGNWLATYGDVKAEQEAYASALASNTAAATAHARATADLAALDQERQLFEGGDVKAIQRHIGTNPDGKWGSDTAKRIADRKDQAALERATATANAQKWADVIAKGLPPKPAEGRWLEALIIAAALTLAYAVASFAGGRFLGLQEEVDTIDALEDGVDDLEKTMTDVVHWLRQDQQAA